MCIGEDLPEIELVSLVSESLPQYKLRADTVTDFTNYSHEDWGIKQPPLVAAQDLPLSNAQISEVLKYFRKFYTVTLPCEITFVKSNCSVTTTMHDVSSHAFARHTLLRVMDVHPSASEPFDFESEVVQLYFCTYA